MAPKTLGQIPSPNPDPQKDGLLRDDITHLQEQPRLPGKPPKSLLDWLVRVHLRLIALDQERKNNSS